MIDWFIGLLWGIAMIGCLFAFIWGEGGARR